MGEEPNPASFEKTPRLKPHPTHAPSGGAGGESALHDFSQAGKYTLAVYAQNGCACGYVRYAHKRHKQPCHAAQALCPTQQHRRGQSRDYQPLRPAENRRPLSRSAPYKASRARNVSLRPAPRCPWPKAARAPAIAKIYASGLKERPRPFLM